MTQAVNDDISHIQSQNRGLQVQTQNQRALMNEIRNLLVGASFRPEETTAKIRKSKLCKLIPMRL